MKKLFLCLLISTMAFCLISCGNSNHKTSESKSTEQIGEGISSQLVMVDDVLYQNTGYISSMPRCGTMDGTIDSKVDVEKVPEKNNQSNFATDLEYQYGSQNCILVFINEKACIFRDINYNGDAMPAEVANFKAQIKDIWDTGMRVSCVSVPDEFSVSSEADISIENLQYDAKVGDIVKIWYDGLELETYPSQINTVYRIEKTKVDK